MAVPIVARSMAPAIRVALSGIVRSSVVMSFTELPPVQRREIGLRALGRPPRAAAPSLRVRSRLGDEMPAEEAGQLVERDHVDLVVEIDVAGSPNDHQFLRLRGRLIGGFAEVARMAFLAVDQQNRARRD